MIHVMFNLAEGHQKKEMTFYKALLINRGETTRGEGE